MVFRRRNWATAPSRELLQEFAGPIPNHSALCRDSGTPPDIFKNRHFTSNSCPLSKKFRRNPCAPPAKWPHNRPTRSISSTRLWHVARACPSRSCIAAIHSGTPSPGAFEFPLALAPVRNPEKTAILDRFFLSRTRPAAWRRAHKGLPRAIGPSAARSMPSFYGGPLNRATRKEGLGTKRSHRARPPRSLV